MNQLTARREKAGLSQEEVALALKIDRSTVAKWETGASYPRADKLPAIAALYGCSIDALFRDSSSEDKAV